MAIVVAQAEKRDVLAMANLFQEMDQFYDEPNPEPIDRKVSQINALIFSDPPAAHVLLAWDDSRLVGLASYSFLWPAAGVSQSLFLKELYVASGYRRQGVGKLLMKNLMTIAAQRECSRVEWMTDDSNKAAQDFYRDLGVERDNSKVFYRLEGPPFSELI
jgi:ribosomal protein S18 acetylase RimI-like enzyme